MRPAAASRCPTSTAASSCACRPQPYVRFDTNDYSLDPRLVGRRVEVRVGQRQITAVALDTGELAARHRRSFAKHLTITDPAHQALARRAARRAPPRPSSRSSCARWPATTP